jgi:hypothetical protein
VHRLERVLLLCTVHFLFTVCKVIVSVHCTHFYVPSGMYIVCVQSTYFRCTVWKEFCFCAQYTFLLHRLESVLFVCTVYISDILFEKCSISVHSTHF